MAMVKGVNNNEVWVFTFGFGQKYEGKYVKFSGDFSEARRKMVEKYGLEWAFQYSEKDWNSYIEKAKKEGLPVETELKPEDE